MTGLRLRLEGVRRGLAYGVAVVLPWVSSAVVAHSGVLREFPFALQFVVITGIARYLGLAPALVAAVSAAFAFNYYILPPVDNWSLDRYAVARTGIVLAAGVMAGILSRQRRRAQDERDLALVSLQETTTALIEAQQGSRAAAWMYRPAEGRTHFYPGGADIFPVPLEELSALGSPMSVVLEEDLPKIVAAAALTEETGAPFRVEFQARWPSGEVRWLESRGTPAANDRTIWRGVTIDVTDRKRAELALLQSEKLAAVGRLASTLAHEINNPLEAITNLIYLAQTDAGISSQARGYLELADQEVARLGGITRLTLNFVRSKRPEGPCDLAEVAAGVVALFKPKCEARGITLACSRSAGLRVAIAPDELRQILTNLVSNASDAFGGVGMTAAGAISIRVRGEDGCGVIEVEDNGDGIASEHIGQVFDAFFTTKDDIGTGIGLWVTKELVEKNGGAIGVESGEGRTVFKVAIPLAKTEFEN
jgi:signal transduction histidine kinase